MPSSSPATVRSFPISCSDLLIARAAALPSVASGWGGSLPFQCIHRLPIGGRWMCHIGLGAGEEARGRWIGLRKAGKARRRTGKIAGPPACEAFRIGGGMRRGFGADLAGFAKRLENLDRAGASLDAAHAHLPPR